jgi:hypothetical protein
MKITEAKYLMHAMKSGTANNDVAEFSNQQKAIMSVVMWREHQDIQYIEKIL